MNTYKNNCAAYKFKIRSFTDNQETKNKQKCKL